MSGAQLNERKQDLIVRAQLFVRTTIPLYMTDLKELIQIVKIGVRGGPDLVRV
jgi:hypothetical protein